MEDFGSKSYRDGVGPTGTGMQDLRCYSASYASSVASQMGSYSNSNNNNNRNISIHDLKLKKGKSTNGLSSKSWSFNDPELLRKKRVASYKAYSVEGKVKGSFKKSFRWLKDRCTRIVQGW